MCDTVIITYIFCLFLDNERGDYFQIGKFCLFMVYKLNVKWPAKETEGQRELQLASFQPHHLKNLIHEMQAFKWRVFMKCKLLNDVSC